MRIAFLGTPEFALPSLLALFARGDSIAVFTQPDRPIGRKAILTPPPVKALALSLGLPVYQFEKIRSKEGRAALEAFAPDLMVTAAFGQLLSAKNLAIPKHGTINVHGSLLPKYRGASPIQSAIRDGETVTGVTTMFTDVGMDTGDMLLYVQTAIDPDENAEQLGERLSKLGADLLLETLRQFEAGTLKRIPQDDAQATICHMLTKQDGVLDFSKPCTVVHNCVRAMNPWPTATALLDGQPLKLWQTAHTPIASSEKSCGSLFTQGNRLFVQCQDGALEILSLQLPGKKRMNAADFLRGASIEGKVLQ